MLIAANVMCLIILACWTVITVHILIDSLAELRKRRKKDKSE